MIEIPGLAAIVFGLAAVWALACALLALSRIHALEHELENHLEDAHQRFWKRAP